MVESRGVARRGGLPTKRAAASQSPPRAGQRSRHTDALKPALAHCCRLVEQALHIADGAVEAGRHQDTHSSGVECGCPGFTGFTGG